MLIAARGRTPPDFGILNNLAPWLTRAIEGCATVDDVERVVPRNDALHYHREIARECDGVTVTTPRLAAIFAQYNANVWVLPNCLDLREECYQATNRQVPHDGIIIGWAGGLEHLEDLQLIRPVLAEVLSKYNQTGGPPRVRLMIGGSVTIYEQALGQLPGVQRFLDKIQRVAPHTDLAYGWSEEVNTIESDCGRYLYRHTVPIGQYPLFYRDVDIGIVPNHTGLSFQESRSDIKGLEMAAMGVPIVASPISEYVHWRSKETGALLPAGNRLEGWMDMLCRLVENCGLRRYMADEALEFVATRSIDKWVHSWIDAYAATAERCDKSWAAR